MTSSIEITDNSRELNGPVSREKLSSILNEIFNKDEPIPSSVELVLGQLNELSSKHKFIVNVTKLNANNVNTADFSVDSYIGSSWNDKSDGAFHYQIPLGSGQPDTKRILLVSVYWILL